ncbi:polysaccharide deacetylase family protein [Polyangium jinanense]|uniref:Polysaccharide deacetylase family protein n=1 Tax=Polyangium jinanense TaxID=2829994 RepID=A0A9X4AZ41_9BACT|nr:polysaccharide deacetylase family protein [Polyangium jinanense]MDC3957715.1 polysaccharide deacetylase family protein [Polyangium jinanense]MDC3987772.1 polysaccharide deacetylase family protein [Polyangium jinanense]
MRAVYYHNVVDEALDPFDRSLSRAHQNRFRREIEELRRQFEIVPLDEALRRLEAGERSDRTLTITFDDGYAGVYEHARPVLAELGLTAAVFVCTQDGALVPPDRLLHFERLEIAFRLSERAEIDLSYLGLGRRALGALAARLPTLKQAKAILKTLPEDERHRHTQRLFAELGVDEAAIDEQGARSPKFRKLSLAQAQDLVRAGWALGGHGRTHRTMSRLPDDELRREIFDNAAELTASLGLEGAPFAYPYGGSEHVDERAARFAREAGFSCAFTTEPGTNERATPRYRLRRFVSLELLRDMAVTPAQSPEDQAGNLR